MKNKRLVNKIPYEEKLKMTTGIDNWNLYIPNVLNGMKVSTSDGPIGLRFVKDGKTEKSVCFTNSCALACSFDKKLVFDVGKSLGQIANSLNVDLLLGPGINLKRNPLCGRNFEYFSEDPILSGKMGAAYIKGLQSTKTGACLKHYILNNQEFARYSVSANVDKKALHELYLKNFMIAIKEGKPKTIMSSYNRVNHEYVNESKDLLDIPRKEWGFEGIYLSDWSAVSSRRRSFLAGTNIEMPASDSYKEVFPAQPSDLMSQEVLNISTDQIVSFIKDINHKTGIPYDLSSAHKLSEYASANSTVLIKNEDNILPLKRDEKVAIIGRLAKEPYFEGDGSAKVNPYKVDSMIDSLRELNVAFTYADGYNKYMNTNAELLEEAVKISKNAKKVVIIGGYKPYHESEGRDRENIRIPYSIEKIIKAVKEVNPNIVLIIETGAPVELPYVDIPKAILIPYLGGEAVNNALILNLYGVVSPSGKLAETWPISLNDSPAMFNYIKDYKDQYLTESIYVGYRYYDKAKKDVMFSFGHGLSYSKFKLSGFKLKINKKNINVEVKVKNIGNFDASTPILIYSAKPISATFRPLKELLDFEKVFLKKRETKTIKFEIPSEYLAVYDYSSSKMLVENGLYNFMIGTDSLDLPLSKTKKVRFGSSIEDINYLAEDYYLLNNKFNMESFKKLYQMKMLDDNEEVNFDSNINDFSISSNGDKIKTAIYKNIEKENMDKPERIIAIKETLETIPIRYWMRYIHLYTKEEFKIIFDIVNGKNTNYKDFLNLKR